MHLIFGFIFCHILICIGLRYFDGRQIFIMLLMLIGLLFQDGKGKKKGKQKKLTKAEKERLKKEEADRKALEEGNPFCD